MSVHVVWFRSDRFVQGHAPLARAAALSPVICLHVVNPGDAREAVEALDAQLVEVGGRLTLRQGSVVAALEELHERHRVAAVWAHHEDGDEEREAQVSTWTRQHGAAFKLLVRGAPERVLRVQVPSNVDHGVWRDVVVATRDTGGVVGEPGGVELGQQRKRVASGRLPVTP
ncbi:MAG: deoxyribodipyrimidine photo-lyase [Myxococcota bacterium]